MHFWMMTCTGVSLVQCHPSLPCTSHLQLNLKTFTFVKKRFYKGRTPADVLSLPALLLHPLSPLQLDLETSTFAKKAPVQEPHPV